MPVDARHLRRIPSGRRFARALARVFAATFADVRPILGLGYTPALGELHQAVVRLAMNALGVELAAGYLRTLRRAKHGRFLRSSPVGIRRRVVFAERGMPYPARTKALRFDPGDGSILPEPAPSGQRLPPTRIPPTAIGTAELPEAPRLLIDFNLFRPEVRVAAEQSALRLAGTIVEDTRRMIREELATGLEAGEPVAAIATRVRDVGFSPRRAATIAQTESSRAMHAGQGIAARELGVTEWSWLASSDACDLCLDLDGKTVRIGEAFYVHPTGRAAYRVVEHPPAHPHCYCAATEVAPDD